MDTERPSIPSALFVFIIGLLIWGVILIGPQVLNYRKFVSELIIPRPQLVEQTRPRLVGPVSAQERERYRAFEDFARSQRAQAQAAVTPPTTALPEGYQSQSTER